ncbi:MAG: 2-oxoacid:ferredoxin oxidoreductase subunit beta [Bryobacteraceae bacterium]|jgi:2-oxoglutarate ferredoxin oxidoreductase subunit beta
MSAAPPIAKKVNRLDLEILSYRGGKSTLCAGCGHNAITERITEAFWEMGVEPWGVMKFSGIGCSAKTPAYFMNASFGLNAVHGRAPTVATGAILANTTMPAIIVTGDGDTASIGLGHFMHMLRRNVPLVYVIENNGVYGLTKGQFSATADYGSKLKTGVINDMQPVDCCLAGIEMGATFVARSFSGDKRQLASILKAAIAHRGLAVIDVISPCVTFNDHEGSTRSYQYMKDHDEPVHEVDFIPSFIDIDVEFDEGTTHEVEMHDGSRIRLKKIGRDYDPTNALGAITAIHESKSKLEVLTGLLYLDQDSPTLIDKLKVVDEPLATLPQDRVRPSREALAQIMDEFR